MRRALVAMLLALASACQGSPAPSGVQAGIDDAPRVPAVEPVGETRLTCVTMRDVATSDTVQLVGKTLFDFEEADGLTLFDLSDPDAPKPRGHVAAVGTPLAMFVREGLAWLAYVDWGTGGTGPSTVIEAVDVSREGSPVSLGRVVEPGMARPPRLVGGVLHVLVDDVAGARVDAFAIRRGRVVRVDQTALLGRSAALAASSTGLVAVTNADDGTKITAIELPSDPAGAQTTRGTATVPGGVLAALGDQDRVVVDDGQVAHVVTCTTRECAPNDITSLRTIDFGAAGAPKVSAPVALGRRGRIVTRFSNETLFVAEPTSDRASILRTVTLSPGEARIASELALPVEVGSLTARGDQLVVVGKVGAGPGRGARLAVIDLDVARPAEPRRRGALTFGEDWSWSPAALRSESLSFDPTGRLVAIPFAAVEDGRYGSATQVALLTAHGPKAAGTLANARHAPRAVFFEGRLLTVGPDGVRSVPYAPGAATVEEGVVF